MKVYLLETINNGPYDTRPRHIAVFATRFAATNFISKYNTLSAKMGKAEYLPDGPDAGNHTYIITEFEVEV